MISPAKLGNGRQKYYLQQLASDREAYLSGRGEAPGYTVGRAWETLGISGEVTAEQFERVFIGGHPNSGAPLGRAHRKNGVLAYDFVFRPTKSVALLYGLGTVEESAAAMAAHHAGLQDAVAYLEGFAKVRRGHNGVEKASASGLLCVAFDHRASRPGDPLPHTHLIVMNRAEGPDGRWTALDGRPILEELKNADAIYRATYQRQLTHTLGVEWAEPDGEGNRELVGMDADLLHHFSKAHAAIEEELCRRQAEGLPVTPAVENWVAHQVREDKKHEQAPAQWARWADEAATNGWDVRAMFARMRGRVRTQDQLADSEREAIFAQLACPEGLTAQSSTFTRGQVIRGIGNQVATLPAAEIERLADQFLIERAVEVLIDPRTHAQRYSTPELLEVERRIVDRAAARAAEARHVVPSGTIRAVLERYERLGKPLGADQAEVLRSVCSDGSGLSLVVGRAGTGKTFTMDAVRTAFETASTSLSEHRRVSVRGLAPTGIAAVELDHGAGIDAITVDRFLADLDNGRDALTSTDAVVLDEANMLGTRKFARLQAHADRVGAKLIVVGDDRQLQSIDAGGWFRSLRLRQGGAELTENRRQRDHLDQQAVELIRQGRGEEALGLYRDGGRVTVAKTAVEAYEAMARDWWQAFCSGEDAVMLAHRRIEVDRLNDLAHHAMAAAGRLSGPALENQDREFRIGDRVVCGANSLDRLGVANGTKGWVTGLDPQAHTLTVKLDSEREVTLPGSYLRAKLSDGRRPVNHAYAITGHKSEGITVDRVFIRGGSHADQHWAYVVASRVRKRADFYLIEGLAAPERDEAGILDLAPPMSADPYDVAVAALGRCDPQRMAIDAARETTRPLVSSLSTRELRAERDQLAGVLATRPHAQLTSFRRTVEQRVETEQRLGAARDRQAQLESWLASHGRGISALARRAEAKAARDELAQVGLLERYLTDRVEQLVDRERQLRRHEQQRAVWDEAHAPEVSRDHEVRGELAWRSRAQSKAHQIDPPEWLTGLLGPAPDSRRGQRSWRAAAERIASYRDRYQITDQHHALGAQPRDLAQRREWRDCQQSIERICTRNRDTGRDMTM
jgi:conjugative relaxase-like TrwC/TraI family protein